MKKSDIAIYISAVLTLILTTFVVFSTQNVTYDEKKIDDILKKKVDTSSSNVIGKSDSGSDPSPLFNNKLSDDNKSDDKKDKPDDNLLSGAPGDNKDLTDKKPADSMVSDKKEPKRSFADINNLDLLSGTDNTPRDSKPTPKIHKFDNNHEPQGTGFIKKQTTRVRTAPRVAMAHKPRLAQDTIPAAGGKRFHTVSYGDTMWKIAARYGVTTKSVVRANSHLANPNIIYPGMRLNLP